MRPEPAPVPAQRCWPVFSQENGMGVSASLSLWVEFLIAWGKLDRNSSRQVPEKVPPISFRSKFSENKNKWFWEIMERF